jgi:hypothetical protein
MVCLGRWQALQDGSVDGEVAFDERPLKQGREAKTLRIACISAVREQGQSFVFGGTCLREQVAEKLLGRAADLLRHFRTAEDGDWEPP